jgi:O-antigen/teichoic acid export membrane protein
MTGGALPPDETFMTGAELPVPAADVQGTGVRTIGRQAILNVGSVLLAGVYTIWLTAYLVGSLGNAGYGAWATITAILTPLMVLDAGLGLLVIRAAAAHGTREAESTAEVTAAHGLYLGLGTVGLVAGIVLGFLPGPLLGLSDAEAQQTRLAAWILAADFGLVIGTSALPGLLRGRRRFDAMLAASLAQVAGGVVLTIILVPSLGLVGAALAQLASHAIGRFVQLGFVRRLVPWFSPMPRPPRWRYLRTVLRFSGPLIVISIASQISFSTDVLVVGAIAGATAASAIAIGARLPILAVSLLTVATDVLFPVFVEEERLQPGRPPVLLRRGLLAAGLMSGCAFAFLASARTEILAVWVPGVDPIAETVFAIYCATWAIHVPAHVLALVIIAHDRHMVLAPIVLIESIANLVLSIGFVLAIGPVGAAIGSFIAVGISNGLVLPVVTRARIGVGIGRILSASVIGLTAGGLIAGFAWVVVEVVGLEAVPRLIAQTVVTGALGLAALALAWTGGRSILTLRGVGPS